jgi:hypothetical protein
MGRPFQPTGVKLDAPGVGFWYVEETARVEEFNCHVSLSSLLEQMGTPPDLASAVKAQAAGR